MSEKGKPDCFIRFTVDDFSGSGCIINGKVYRIINGDIFGDYKISGKACSLDDINFLPPCIPQKIICVGLNYEDHLSESTISEIPDEPILFFKPPSSTIGHLDNIIIPDWVDRVDYEGELAVVIGKNLKNASLNESAEGIFGYTCLNDVTARNIQKKDLQWTRAKGFDSFCPIGPVIKTSIDGALLDISTHLNGKVVQQSNTGMLMRKPAELISYISKVMTLYPGDIISTGTSKGTGPLAEGDVVEVTIEGIGTLKNFVVAE
jgi:2-keto-4-pentenoate hydratase/2-oxohepta-3-ene-1,7-dioic acid hydratase in catechol pathway